MKARIANGSWRFIHWLSWLAFVAATSHAFLIGTDARSGIGLAVVISCALAVVATALWRYLKRPRARWAERHCRPSRGTGRPATRRTPPAKPTGESSAAMMRTSHCLVSCGAPRVGR